MRAVLVVFLLLFATGCGSSYAELLTIYEAERSELDRLRSQKEFVDKVHSDTFRDSLTKPDDPGIKESLGKLEARQDELNKKITEQEAFMLKARDARDAAR